MNVDFAMARTKHLAWKTRLRNYLSGRDNALDKAQATSPKHCDLGVWLYADGLRKFGTQADMQKLEKVHAEMHATVGRVMAAKERGNMEAAEKELANVARLSEEVIRLLNAVEVKVS